MDKKLLRAREVAELLAVQESTVRKWILLAKLPVVKIGRSVRIEFSVIEKLIAEGRIPARGV